MLCLCESFCLILVAYLVRKLALKEVIRRTDVSTNFMKNYLIFVLLILTGCHPTSSKVEQLAKDTTIILPNGNSVKGIDPIDTAKGQIPPPKPPRYVYGDFNILLVNDTVVYYHKKLIRLICGTGYDPEKPIFINLQPKDLTIIRSESIEAFLRDTILPKEKIRNRLKDRLVVISIMNDTMRSRTIEMMLSQFRKIDFYNYVIRRISEEEQMVLIAKMTNQAYDPQNIKWKNEFFHNE